MNFSLTDEQAMIRESARRFIVERSVRRGDKCTVDRSNWLKLAEQGFLSVGLPEEFGGMGGAVEMALICQEFGRGPLLEPYVSSTLFAGQIVLEAGNEEQTSSILPHIASGELILSVAYREAGNPVQAAPLLTRATRDATGFTIDGQKALVIAGGDADLFIASAAIEGDADPRALSLFLVDPKQRGVKVTPLPLVDGSWCAEVNLTSVRVPHSNLLGVEGRGEDYLAHALQFATLGACSEVVGAAKQSLATTAEYLITRKQFGAPLMEFQALRMKIAEMVMDCELGQAAIHRLIAAFQDPANFDPNMTTASMKVMVDEIGHRVCSQAIQLHGGMGLTEECGIGQFYARTALIRSLYGSTANVMEEYTSRLVETLMPSARLGAVRRRMARL